MSYLMQTVLTMFRRIFITPKNRLCFAGFFRFFTCSTAPAYSNTLKLIKAAELEVKVNDAVKKYKEEEHKKESYVDQQIVNEYTTIVTGKINNNDNWVDGKFVKRDVNDWYFLVCDVVIRDINKYPNESTVVKKILNDKGYFVKIYKDGMSISFDNIEKLDRVTGLNEFMGKRFC